MLDDILSQAPRGSSVFSALLEPYQKTLASRQLDPRLDERYYSLLLKLSLVTGTDWSAKWARVCADQGLFDRSDAPDDSLSLLSASQINGTEGSDDEEEGTTTIIAPKHPPPFSSPSWRRGSLYPIQSTPNRPVHSDPRSSPSSKLSDPLDALSDQFRSEHIRRRALHLWIHRIQCYILTVNEVERVRNALVQARMWRRWRARVGKRHREVRMVEGVARTRYVNTNLSTHPL